MPKGAGDQLAARPQNIRVKGASAKKLAEFLLGREVTVDGQISGDATGKVETKVAPRMLAHLLGEFGIGIEFVAAFLRSGFVVHQAPAEGAHLINMTNKAVCYDGRKVWPAQLKSTRIHGCFLSALPCGPRSAAKQIHYTLSNHAEEASQRSLRQSLSY